MGNNGARFSAGDFVKISNDLTNVQELQKGHGEWVDSMKKTLGKVGVVKSVYPSGNLRVKVKDKKWTFNPQCCTLLMSMSPDHEDSSSDSDDDASATLGSLLAQLTTSKDEDESTVAHRFINAAKDGQIETVQDLLKNHPNEINSKASGKTALHLASHKGQTSVLMVLLEAGASLDIKDNDELTALQCAVIGNRSGAVRLLLQKGADVNAVDKCGDTPLHNAIYHGATEVEPLLVHYHNIDFSIKNKSGFNVLQFAALKGDEVATKLILEKHPEMVDNKKEDGGYSALHIAAVNGHDQVARLLIEKKAEVNSRDNDQKTPLHLAAFGSHLTVVELLVANGANVNAQDGERYAPLHQATLIMSQIDLKLRGIAPLSMLEQLGNKNETSTVNIAYFLVTNGADVNIKNHKGETPLDLVLEPAKKEALRMFAALSS